MITKDDVLNSDYDFYAVLALIDKIAELEKDVAFLQSCVNSGETATKLDRPSSLVKALNESK